MVQQKADLYDSHHQQSFKVNSARIHNKVQHQAFRAATSIRMTWSLYIVPFGWGAKDGNLHGHISKGLSPAR